MAYYFAYGNNMRAATMVDRCGLPGEGSWKEIGVARLRDHRLAFTVSTPNWQGPVGDIEARKHFFVYGFLYAVSEANLADLDDHEYAVGTTTFYRRRTMVVELYDPDDILQEGRMEEAQVYSVGEEKRHPERPPEPRYLRRLVDAARERELPADYIRALESLDARTSERGERNLLVLPTRDRSGQHAFPIVQIAPNVKRRLGLRRIAFVVLEDRACLASVIEREELENRGLVCGVDETIRRSLRVPMIEPGKQYFGARIELRPAQRPSHRDWISARHLLLNIEQVEYLDAERGIAVVPEAILRMLGIDHGDYISIEVALPDPESSDVKVGRLRRRAFTGSTQRRQVGRKLFDYPEDGRLHIDLDGRRALGLIGNYTQPYPVMVSASTKHLLLKRSLFYSLALIGVTVGLTDTVMPPLLEVILDKPVSQLLSFVAALGTATALGVIAVWVDLSQRLRP
jgi:hypothetical protein